MVRTPPLSVWIAHLPLIEEDRVKSAETLHGDDDDDGDDDGDGDGDATLHCTMVWSLPMV